MILKKLEYLEKVDRFYRMLIEQAKTDVINEAEFYLLLGVKCKAMNKERISRKVLLSKKAN